MKSIMIAVAAMVVGLSTGCAEVERIRDQANDLANQQKGEIRMGRLCYGDSRDDAWWQCAGYQTPAQIAQKAEQEKIAEEKQAIAWAKENAANQIARDKAEKRRVIEAKKQAIADRQLVIAEKKAGERFNAAVRKAEAKTKAAWNALTPAQQKTAQVEAKCMAQALEMRLSLSFISDYMRSCKIEANMMDQVEYLQSKVK